MNVPPTDFIRVDHRVMHDYVFRVFVAHGLSEENARFLADCLVGNDLRGVFSHGTRQVKAYTHLFREGMLNPQPSLGIVSETATTIHVDGDGSLGYFAARLSTEKVIEKARAHGVAVGITDNHGHFGAAGLYTRMLVKEKLLGHATSGAQRNLLHLGSSVMAAVGGSPHSFGVPTHEQPPIIVDFGAVHDLHGEVFEMLLEKAPGIIFRLAGMGAICQTFGGLLPGLRANINNVQREWTGANQGSYVVAVDPGAFRPVDEFLAEMDEYVSLATKLKPLKGQARAYLPGGIEAEREIQWSEEGIPIAPDHAEGLRESGRAMEVDAPF